MTVVFDRDRAELVEFGVGAGTGRDTDFFLVPVDKAIREALWEMLLQTNESMQRLKQTPRAFEPSEKYGNMEHLYIRRANAFSRSLYALHDAENLEVKPLSSAVYKELRCYFARFFFKGDTRFTALRRAAYFKGILKKRLIRVVNDSLKIVEDDVFKLDNDFDLIVDNNKVHVLRPAGLVALGDLTGAILEAAVANIEIVKVALPFLDVTNITSYATTHIRAAKYLASVQHQTLEGIELASLHNLCKNTGVEVTQEGGELRIVDGHVLGFLQVLDRRRYLIELIGNRPEVYRADSRSQVK